MERNSGDEFATAFARIECHYFVNNCFMRNDSQLLDDVGKIRHIPCVIVQGRYDMVCPATSAHDLHQAFPEAELIIVPDAGHSMSEPGIKAALLDACDKFGRAVKRKRPRLAKRPIKPAKKIRKTKKTKEKVVSG